MTAGEMRGTVQDLIGPHNGMRPLNAATIDEFIFKATHTVFHEVLNWRSRGKATVNIVAGTAAYDLPADFLNMLAVWTYNSSGEGAQLLPIPYDQRYEYSQRHAVDTYGVYFMDVGSTPDLASINLIPTPTTSITGGLKIHYRRRPARLSTFAVSDEYTEVDPAMCLPVCYEAAWLYLGRQGSKAIKEFAAYHDYFRGEVLVEQRRNQEEWQQDQQPGINIRFGGLE